MRRNTAAVILPIGALIVLFVLFCILRSQSKIGHALYLDSIDAQAAAVEKFRIIWAASAFAVSASLLANVALATVTLTVVLRREERRTRWLFAAGTILAAVVFTTAVTRVSSAGPFAEQILARIHAAADVDVGRLTYYGNVLACVSVSIMLASLSALALRDRLCSVVELSRVIRLWHFSISAAATLLAAGVIEVWSLYRWGAAAVSAPDAAPVQAVADGLALAAAVCFTVLLAAMYLPVAAVHSRWLVQLTTEQAKRVENFETDKWLAQHGIKSSPITVGTALLFPAVAFVLTSLIKKVTE